MGESSNHQSQYTEAEHDPDVERLSRELFFHYVTPNTYAPVVAHDIVNGSALMAIAGRATIRRGIPDTYGPNLVFRVPEEIQSAIFTTTLDPETDLGLTDGRNTILALMQQPTWEQEAAIRRWLSSPHRSSTMDRYSQLPIDQIISQIRFLDSEFFLGLYDIEEDEDRIDIRRSEQLIHSFVKNVRCVLPNPEKGITANLLERGINYYIRYNPLNKRYW